MMLFWDLYNFMLVDLASFAAVYTPETVARIFR